LIVLPSSFIKFGSIISSFHLLLYTKERISDLVAAVRFFNIYYVLSVSSFLILYHYFSITVELRITYWFYLLCFSLLQRSRFDQIVCSAVAVLKPEKTLREGISWFCNQHLCYLFLRPRVYNTNFFNVLSENS
jgi:hypothetical protein